MRHSSQLLARAAARAPRSYDAATMHVLRPSAVDNQMGLQHSIGAKLSNGRCVRRRAHMVCWTPTRARPCWRSRFA
eukprot:973858-Pleurochrysis_carterae.AAC.1